ncbi:hypothetical protein [Poseidonibacter lekithochrous]|uniref:hypothetical protein n=1 Tax=Poseidonibacter lekithochrous TaxID=1904463 RepID=UPI0008FC6EED|nr:hypothetical protein [Poseidonibacter lekithochrous]QKJ23162.1 hypothetical protein ALEK_1899 [Poseidonibacter lekithochrous]
MKNEVDNIRKDTYESKYIVALENEDKSLKNLELIDGNSNYVFFINKENKKITAIPYQNVRSIEKKE